MINRHVLKYRLSIHVLGTCTIMYNKYWPSYACRLSIIVTTKLHFNVFICYLKRHFSFGLSNFCSCFSSFSFVTFQCVSLSPTAFTLHSHCTHNDHVLSRSFSHTDHILFSPPSHLSPFLLFFNFPFIYPLFLLQFMHFPSYLFASVLFFPCSNTFPATNFSQIQFGRGYELSSR